MTSRRLGLFAIVMLAAAGSTGCKAALEIAALSLQVAPAVIEVAAAASAASERSHNANACCDRREVVDVTAERSMSACELERGRWREAHQDQNDVPEELRCLDDGTYPRITPYYAPHPPGPLQGGNVDMPPPAPAAPEAVTPPDTI